MFTNCYVHCGMVWADDWDCACNDECPVCHGEIEPFATIEDGDLGLFVGQAFIPEGGWPAGMSCLEDLIDRVH